MTQPTAMSGLKLELYLAQNINALEPNSETGRSRSLVRKRGTTNQNQSALLTV